MKVLTKVLLLAAGLAFSLVSHGPGTALKTLSLTRRKWLPGCICLPAQAAILALVSGDGAPVLIDDQYAEMADKIRFSCSQNYGREGRLHTQYSLARRSYRRQRQLLSIPTRSS